MKFLIASACVAVIALAVYVIGGDYLAASRQDRNAFYADCKRTIENPVADIAALSKGESFRLKTKLDDCGKFLRTGKLP